jgi:hypothetical protein
VAAALLIAGCGADRIDAEPAQPDQPEAPVNVIRSEEASPDPVEGTRPAKGIQGLKRLDLPPQQPRADASDVPRAVKSERS